MLFRSEIDHEFWKHKLEVAYDLRRRMGLSVILSIISVIGGLVPYYCIYRGADLYIRNIGQVPVHEIIRWCILALVFYVVKIVCFSASTWISHIAAYHILEGLRLRLTDRFLKAPLGDVEGHSIGEIKSIMVEKIENKIGRASCRERV